MLKFQHILFDLDGTLVDSKDGIVNSTVWAFHELELPEPAVSDIEIGPPILETIKRLLGPSNAHFYEDVVRAYRRRYTEVGVKEVQLYDGIIDSLKTLEPLASLYVATSKPTVFAEKILSDLSLSPFFKRIYGSELSGERSSKTELISYVLKEENIDKHQVVLVGDRMHDVVGGRENDIPVIGAAWGYGSPEELLTAGAHSICRSPSELIGKLLG